MIIFSLFFTSKVGVENDHFQHSSHMAELFYRDVVSLLFLPSYFLVLTGVFFRVSNKLSINFVRSIFDLSSILCGKALETRSCKVRNMAVFARIAENIDASDVEKKCIFSFTETVVLPLF